MKDSIKGFQLKNTLITPVILSDSHKFRNLLKACLHIFPQQFSSTVPVSPCRVKAGRELFHVLCVFVLPFPPHQHRISLYRSVLVSHDVHARGTGWTTVASRSRNPSNNSAGIWLGSTSRRINSRNTASSSGVKGSLIVLPFSFFSLKYLVIFTFYLTGSLI